MIGKSKIKRCILRLKLFFRIAKTDEKSIIEDYLKTSDGDNKGKL